MCDCSQSSKDIHSTDMGSYWLVQILCVKCGRVLHEYRVNKPKNKK